MFKAFVLLKQSSYISRHLIHSSYSSYLFSLDSACCPRSEFEPRLTYKRQISYVSYLLLIVNSEDTKSCHLTFEDRADRRRTVRLALAPTWTHSHTHSPLWEHEFGCHENPPSTIEFTSHIHRHIILSCSRRRGLTLASSSEKTTCLSSAQSRHLYGGPGPRPAVGCQVTRGV